MHHWTQSDSLQHKRLKIFIYINISKLVSRYNGGREAKQTPQTSFFSLLMLNFTLGRRVQAG